MIDVKNLTKRFGDLVAVDDVSFEVAKGEMFGLLGPNGAGKTTTINMLIGALKPSAGSVALSGQPDPTQAGVRRIVGMAPQSLSLYDELTCAENLAFFARMYGLAGKKLHERIDWGLEFAGLEERRKSKVKTFSGGMKRRLNLACALAHEPDIVLLDEPTVGVDPQSRNHIFERIEVLKKAGLTVIYTTHYMEEAERLCDRVAIMDRGSILALGTIDELIAAHGGTSVVMAELKEPPGEGVKLEGQLDGTALRLETARPLEAISDLSGRGVAFRTLQVQQPDLETVFLALTGRRLRDE
jgi:linearmycin/streptolysin S transport system ATP-binding protein